MYIINGNHNINIHFIIVRGKIDSVGAHILEGFFPI